MLIFPFICRINLRYCFISVVLGLMIYGVFESLLLPVMLKVLGLSFDELIVNPWFNLIAFVMISSICRKIAEALGRKLEAERDQTTIYAYALEILLGTIIKITLIIVLAMLFGIMKTALIFLFTFALFRWLGGGVHLSTYLGCLIVGLFLVLGMGYVTTLHIDKHYLIGIIV